MTRILFVGQKPETVDFSDPSLPGYGHYAYDHEGTPARRVVHIDRGIFSGFMNSRQTAAIFGGDPNGHWKATDAQLVPLVRMSSTVFAGGEHDPDWWLKKLVERDAIDFAVGPVSSAVARYLPGSCSSASSTRPPCCRPAGCSG